MQILTLNKYIKSNQNKLIMEINALKELLIYLLFVTIISTAMTVVSLFIGKKRLKPHNF